MSRTTLRTATFAAVAALGLAVSGMAATSASAGVNYDDADIDLTVQLGDTPNDHEFALDFACAADGVITFTGEGKHQNGTPEVVTAGLLDTESRTYSFTAVLGNLTWGGVGDLAGSATFGTIPHTGTYITGGQVTQLDLSGSFFHVPDCAPVPVAGNHGQYVSGAAHSGIKGKELAAIAKVVTLVGPFPG